MYGSDWVSLDDLSLDMMLEPELVLKPEDLTVRDVLEALRYERNKSEIRRWRRTMMMMSP